MTICGDCLFHSTSCTFQLWLLKNCPCRACPPWSSCWAWWMVRCPFPAPERVLDFSTDSESDRYLYADSFSSPSPPCVPVSLVASWSLSLALAWRSGLQLRWSRTWTHHSVASISFLPRMEASYGISITKNLTALMQSHYPESLCPAIIIALGPKYSENDPKQSFLNDMNYKFSREVEEIWGVWVEKNPSFVLVCFFFYSSLAQAKVSLSSFLTGKF